MMRKALILALALTIGSGIFSCGHHAQEETYFLKALEIIKGDGDLAKAKELLDKQLEMDPNDADALTMRAQVNQWQDNYSQALIDIKEALKKFSLKANGFPKSYLYGIQAVIYRDIGDFDNAIKCYDTAIEHAQRDDTTSVNELKVELGYAFINNDNLDEAEAILNDVLLDEMGCYDEDGIDALKGLCYVNMRWENYRGAFVYTEIMKAIDTLYAYIQAYDIEATVYDKLGETDNAIEAAIKHIEYNPNEPKHQEDFLNIMIKNYDFSVSKLKGRIEELDADENDESRRVKIQNLWVTLCLLYADNYDWELALKAWDEYKVNYGEYEFLNGMRGYCLENLGLFDLAIEELNKMQSTETDADILVTRAFLYQNLGLYDEAIADNTSAISLDQGNAYYAYYRRGWCYELRGDDDMALADYNAGIRADQSYPYLYLMRGEIYLKRGLRDKANADFGQVLARDTTAESGSCRQYALHFLGKDREALQWMDKIIEADPKEPGNYYDLACLNSRMGRTNEAVAAMEKAFGLGWARFEHIEHDDDLDLIKGLPKFRGLYYKAKERVDSLRHIVSEGIW